MTETRMYRPFDSRHSRAKADTRRAPTGYWYGLIGVDTVLTMTFAVAAAATPSEASFWERAAAGLITGSIALSVGALVLVALTYTWYWWHAPMHLLKEARESIISMLDEFMTARELTGLIERLKACQQDTLELLGMIAIQGQHPDPSVFAAWNDNLSHLMAEAGDEHYARYTLRVAKVSVPNGTTPIPMRDVYTGMIEVITDAIADLSAKREQARMRGQAPVQGASPQ